MQSIHIAAHTQRQKTRVARALLDLVQKAKHKPICLTHPRTHLHIPSAREAEQCESEAL